MRRRSDKALPVELILEDAHEEIVVDVEMELSPEDVRASAGARERAQRDLERFPVVVRGRRS